MGEYIDKQFVASDGGFAIDRRDQYRGSRGRQKPWTLQAAGAHDPQQRIDAQGACGEKTCPKDGRYILFVGKQTEKRINRRRVIAQ
ncbi:MAG TPA: hypothetical protein VGM26_13090 [Rhizomicrobium sp.]